MRTVQAEEIAAAVARLCREANVALGGDILGALEEVLKREKSPQGKGVLEKLLANAALAREENIPLCQAVSPVAVIVSRHPFPPLMRLVSQQIIGDASLLLGSDLSGSEKFLDPLCRLGGVNPQPGSDLL